ncbi:glycoside hydrolase family 9 protein [Balneolales bacterium ANBcel1]|nr:glycoside hydrolase family 9 protein [Balneolales bacterium ANBcel1]
MRLLFQIASMLLAAILLSAAWTSAEAYRPFKVNQAGYHPDADKLAVVPVNGSVLTTSQYQIVDVESGDTVFTGALLGGDGLYWEHSDETVLHALFTDLSTPGTYRIEHPDLGESHPFEISEEVLTEVSRSALKAYYFNRASTEITEPYAGPWARPMGHPDDNAMIHSSAATEHRPVGYTFSSSKGWYDAGDFNKYIVNSGITTYTMLAAYEHFPNYFEELTVNIPESGSGVPDILDELRWNLDWMITMQDPHDGGVYHKLTSPQFSGIIMPHQDNSARYAVQKSTAATLNFAGVMAVASRVYRPYDRGFSERALAAAEFAWQWALEHPNLYYRQDAMNQEHSPDIVTGEYGDSNVSDEFDWAAAELYITTGDDSYWHARNLGNVHGITIPAWPQVRPLAWVSLAHHRDRLTPAANVGHITGRIEQMANELLNAHSNSAYLMSMGYRGGGDFVWGSNSVALNHSLMLLQGYRLTGNGSMLDAAQANLDYVLGRNPTGYSFVTGIGSRTPMDPHHRPSAAHSHDAPVPGLVVGGPHSGQQDGCNYPSDLPALSYVDDWCSYATNEVAINWNAPLVYVAGAIDAIRQETEQRTRARLSAHPLLIIENDSAELIWSATGAQAVTLNGEQVPQSGSRMVQPADTTEYVLIATGEGGEADTARVTINVVPPEKFNRASAGTAQASSSRTGNGPENVIDGIADTYWIADSAGDAWIEVDLLKAFDIRRVVLGWADSGYASRYDVLVSFDGVRWTPLHEVQDGGGGTDEHIGETPVSGRFVRVSAPQSVDGEPLRLSELEVYGLESERQPPAVTLLAPADGQEAETGTVVRFVADITPGNSGQPEAWFLINGEPVADVTSEPFEYEWTAGEPGSYTISVRVTDDHFEIQSRAPELTVVEVPDTRWYEVASASLSGGAELLPDDTARDGVFVRTGDNGSLLWDRILAGERRAYDIRIGYRLPGNTAATLRVRYPPRLELRERLSGTQGEWHYRDFSGVMLNRGENSILLQAQDGSIDIAYLAVRGEGQEVTSTGDEAGVPEVYSLEQNYPNPFNPVTVIGFDLPVQEHVQLVVYDMLGRRVAVLMDGVMPAGSHKILFDASRLASGVYLYRITSGSFVQSRQMMLVK